MEETCEMYAKFWLENLKGRNHFGVLGIDERIILKKKKKKKVAQDKVQ
jgi:hypothetical protein